MVVFLFLSTVLYFNTIFDYDITMQYINNCLGDSILVGSAYNMMGVEPIFSFTYFQLVTSIISQIRSGSVSCYTSLNFRCTFCAVCGRVLPHLMMGKTIPEKTYQRRI